MDQYAVLVMLFSVLTNGALLIGVDGMCGGKPRTVRRLVGTIIMGIHAMTCWEIGASWISKNVTRILLAAAVGWMAFGKDIRKITLYVFLTSLLEGIIISTNNNEMPLVALLLVVVTLLLAAALRKDPTTGPYVPVELNFAGKSIRLTALRDTGNMLRDPVTGTPVLILGSKVSQELTGLSKSQLQRPIEVMRQPPIPGLRLIPYKTISEASGFILGLRIQTVRVGDWKGCLVVAFAPEDFGCKGEFEALTGGMT